MKLFRSIVHALRLNKDVVGRARPFIRKMNPEIGLTCQAIHEIIEVSRNPQPFNRISAAYTTISYIPQPPLHSHLNLQIEKHLT